MTGGGRTGLPGSISWPWWWLDGCLFTVSLSAAHCFQHISARILYFIHMHTYIRGCEKSPKNKLPNGERGDPYGKRLFET